jgi:hypothetical protein
MFVIYNTITRKISVEETAPTTQVRGQNVLDVGDREIFTVSVMVDLDVDVELDEDYEDYRGMMQDYFEYGHITDIQEKITEFELGTYRVKCTRTFGELCNFAWFEFVQLPQTVVLK